MQQSERAYRNNEGSYLKKYADESEVTYLLKQAAYPVFIANEFLSQIRSGYVDGVPPTWRWKQELEQYKNLSTN